nr:MAG TPA: hypothetical protein [Inoviridae sp.]
MQGLFSNMPYVGRYSWITRLYWECSQLLY